MAAANEGARTGIIASVDKAIRVLERLAQPGTTSLSLAELAEELQFNKSSLHHSLTTLRERAWVEQDASGRYQLGPASSLIAHWWASPSQITNLLHPALERICEECRETVHLGRAAGYRVVYLDKVEPDRAVRVVSQVGRMVPAATTAMGRAILGATAANPALASRLGPATSPSGSLDLSPWVDAAASTRSDLTERLAQEIERVSTSGYAVELQENEPGIACVSVPMMVGEHVGAAISVTMPVDRSSSERLRSLAELIASQVETLALPHIRPYRPSVA